MYSNTEFDLLHQVNNFSYAKTNGAEYPGHKIRVQGLFEKFCKCTVYSTIMGFTCTKPVWN